MSVHYIDLQQDESVQTFRGLLIGGVLGLLAWALIFTLIIGVMHLAGVR